MSYNFYPASNVMKIAEQQYGTDNEVRFTIFTSCIGLLAKNNNHVTGVHLVMLSENETLFDNTVADDAVKLIGQYQQVVVIGQTNMWDDNLNKSYQYLIGKLRNPVIIDKNDGTYGGRLNNNIFQTYQNGNYVDVP